MGVLKNDVGRPSNKTIKTRTILKGILLIIIMVAVFAGGYLLNESQNKETTKQVKRDENKVVSTTKKSEKIEISAKEAFDKFVKDNHLSTYKDDEKHSVDEEPRYNLDALKSINCTTATMARPDASVDVYYAEIYTFTDEISAKKEFEKQTDSHKNPSGVTEIYEQNILDEKFTNRYDLLEMKSISEDLDGSNRKTYEYYYGIRIDNYYIVLYRADAFEDDNMAKYMIEDMSKLKKELNLLLNIK